MKFFPVSLLQLGQTLPWILRAVVAPITVMMNFHSKDHVGIDFLHSQCFTKDSQVS